MTAQASAASRQTNVLTASARQRRVPQTRGHRRSRKCHLPLGHAAQSDEKGSGADSNGTWKAEHYFRSTRRRKCSMISRAPATTASTPVTQRGMESPNRRFRPNTRRKTARTRLAIRGRCYPQRSNGARGSWPTTRARCAKRAPDFWRQPKEAMLIFRPLWAADRLCAVASNLT